MKFTAALVLLATPAVALQGNYLSQMGGGNAVKPSSIKPATGRVTSGISGASYLENLAAPASSIRAPEPMAVAPEVAAAVEEAMAAAPSSASYLSSLKVSASPSGSGPAGYLDTLRTQAAASGGAGLVGYLDALPVSAAASGAGIGSYLDALSPKSSIGNLKSAATVTAQVEATSAATMTSNEPVLAAINKLNDNMNRNQQETIAVLHDINAAVKKLIIRDNAAAVEESTELTAALQGNAAPAPALQGSWTGASWR